MKNAPNTGMETAMEAPAPSRMRELLHRYRYLLAGLGVAGIFVLSSIPFHNPSPLRGWDKHLHVVEFFLVGLVVVNGLTAGLRRITRGALGLSWILLLAVAVLNEVYQQWVPGRSGDFRDMLASTLGATIAVLLVWAGAALLKRIRA